jgi:hypothetical protein
VSVYAHSRHVYLEVAGLRLDTSSTGDPRRRAVAVAPWLLRPGR